MKFISFLILFLISLSTLAQNLVPNPSFETYLACPPNFAGLPMVGSPAVSVTDWTQPTLATSDYYNVCAMPTGPFALSVPQNMFGYQPARTGNAYAAGITDEAYPASTYREYIQANLVSPLVTGHRYHASYWVSLAEKHNSSPLASSTSIDQMGIYFGLTPELRYINEVMDDLVPQVKSPSGYMLSDTVNWMKISGVFTSAANYEWIILGNFTPYDSIHSLSLGGSFASQSYYYIDDVCVLDMDGLPSFSSHYDTALCNNPSIIIGGYDTTSSYLWDNNSIQAQRVITQPGTYWRRYVNLDGCVLAVDTFKVTGTQNVSLDIGNDTVICRNTSLTLDASTPGPYQYQWSTGATAPAITITSPGTYFVKVFNDCGAGSDTIIVSEPIAPSAALPEDMLLCKGTPATLQFNQDGISNHWSTGETGCCIDIDSSGLYVLTTTNICGDTASDQINITYSTCEQCILAPSAFTPNGDGLNDVYRVINNCSLKSFSLKIFNRWGQVVFQTNSPDKYWDGNKNGQVADAGVYYYYIRATPAVKDVKEVVVKGDITLFR